MAESDLTVAPRVVFAERFALLYAEAGNPPLKRITETVVRARDIDESGRPVRVPAQRISDWRRGRNVPARFGALAIVLRVLIGEARKRRPEPAVAGLYDMAMWQELWSAALASPISSAADSQRTRVLADAESVCPYRGLASFQQQDADWFFGRTRCTEDLLDRLRQAHRGGGFVVLVGASGAGKSSLLRAGLGPRLAEETLASGQRTEWPVMAVTPGADPVKELASHVSDLAEALGALAGSEQSTDAAPEGYDDEVRAAIAAYARRTSGTGAGMVLVVDQFEEAFTLCTDEDERLLFVRTLHAMCTPAPGEQHPPALVVLGVRADFYDRCLRYPEIVEAMQGRQMALGAMRASELRDAVVRPARAVGLTLEPGLVDLLLSDLGGAVGRATSTLAPAGYDAGALPLLSHALLATWQRRQAGKLTVAGYRAAGGIQGAVAATAEQAWADLDEAGREAARRMLLQLVQVGETTRDTRRKGKRCELVEQHSDDRAAAERALEVLAGARLITLDAESVEITHEALLEAWPRMRSWIDDNRAENLARQRLESDASAWAEQDRDPSLLYRGARLESAERVIDAPVSIGTTAVANEFLTESVRHRRRSVWLRRAGVALVCVFALIAAVAAAVAVAERDEAEFRQLVTESDRQLSIEPSLAAQLTLAAHRMRSDDAAVTSRLLSLQHVPLATPLRGHAGAVYLTSFSPDGGLLATASYDRTVRLWDVRDGSRSPRPISPPLRGHEDWISTAVFSPDGGTMATAGNDGTVRLWDVSDPANPRAHTAPIDGGNGTVYLVDFSPDGNTIVTANEDATARLWDVRDPADPVPLGEPLTGHTGQVRSVAFSPDGATLATTGDDATIRLWDVSDPARPNGIGRPLRGHDSGVHSVTFSPDGGTLASGASDKTVRMWNVAEARPLGPPLTGHAAPVWSVKFSPDGTVLATGSEDSSVQLWNVTAPERAVELGPALESRNNGVFAVSFSPDGTRLATGSGDGIVRLWSLPTTTLVGHTGGVMGAAYRPDGTVLATAGRDGTVRLWDSADPVKAAPLGEPLSGHDSYVKYVAFSGDGTLLASASGDSSARLWDVSDPSKARPVGEPLELGTRYASPLAISPDGRLLATGDDDDTVRLWDISTPAAPVPMGDPLPGHQGYVHFAAFSPDGRTLVTTSSDRTVRLWDVSTPARATLLGEPLTGHGGEVFAAAFTPDGSILATGSGDESVLLWDVRDRRAPVLLSGPLTGHTEEVSSLAFNRDGTRLVTGSTDKTIRLWDTADPRNAAPIGHPLTGHVNTEYSVAFAPRGNVVATASGDHLVRLWDLDAERAIDRICSTTRPVLTEDVWVRYVPQLAYRPPCG